MGEVILKRAIRNFLKSVFVAVSRLVIPLFYKRKYLSGKWFEESAAGWLWAWKGIWWQKIHKFNRNIPWPVSPQIRVSSAVNIAFHPDDLNNFQGFGNYFQNFSAKIVMGRGTYIAPNVGIITANHDPLDLDKHLPGKDVVLGEGCWIGMNSVILPGVVLGPHTIVGAGSVVTRSFVEGNCIIAGNPARVIRNLGDNIEP
ncbi:DapH/DapD/GlmU-related protein [Mesotoga sp. B105.6.4]|uniref:acyltransferase n=1 Tax=Mesotoga sp. B105.6.4 TaxID=1582224 RepID=UPI000CCC23FC|nr:hypothetical protein RJ60_11510 [Mesotoga sp. B105.6.4]